MWTLVFSFCPLLCCVTFVKSHAFSESPFLPLQEVAEYDHMITQLTCGLLGGIRKQLKGRKAGITEPLWATPAEAMLLPLMWHECVSFHRRGKGPEKWNKQQGLSEPGRGCQRVAERDGRDISWAQTSAPSPAVALLTRQSVLCPLFPPHHPPICLHSVPLPAPDQVSGRPLSHRAPSFPSTQRVGEAGPLYCLLRGPPS